MVGNWCFIGADTDIKDEQNGQDHGEHHDVERNKFPKTSAKELKVSLDGWGRVLFNCVRALTSVKIKKTEQSAACFFLICQCSSSFCKY